MKHFFLMLLLLVLGFTGLQAQVVYEDFEGGTADLGWNGLNGTYNGAVANPDPTGANTSAWVGSYTNNVSFDFCFALYTFPTPKDLSVYNQFKMKIWAPTAPCKALLKLEGGGKAVEKIIDITEANKWVDYTFDLSAGASYTGLTTILVSFNSFTFNSDVVYFDDIRAEKAETCYETFEGPSDFTWIALNGTYNGAIANPAPTAVNNSATVGSITNNPAEGYNFAFGTLSGPINLTTYNEFHVKVWVPAATNVLFKLEGSGESKEIIRYVPVANTWQELTFNMGATAAFTTINKVLIVFAPGQAGNSSTYYFDDICAVPNVCATATADPDVLDDFECNRAATYGVGWDSLYVVTNPFPTGDNNSAKVGKFLDQVGPGNEWTVLLHQQENPIDLSVRNEFSLKMYTSVPGNLLLKIEGGNGPKEKFIPITEFNKWVEYKIDLADQIGKGHNKLVMFFNAGAVAAPGDVYYIDDLKLAAPSNKVLEDFQGAIHLGWQALDQNDVLHGVFTGPTANPAPNSVNNSTEVGCYAKGASGFSTLQGISLFNIDLSTQAQLNLDVYSPATGSKVTMILNSASQGNKEASANITTPGQWETLNFDFSAFSGITDFSEVRLIFDANEVAAGESWCFDNLTQSKVTIDPCDGVVAIPNIIDDYECQRNYAYGAGANQIKVVNNPHLTAKNGTLKVGEYKDPANEPWSALCFEFPDGIDLTTYNNVSMQMWGPAVVPCLFKLEGGTSPAVEIWDTLRTANDWYKFNVDFSAAAGQNHKRLCIFFNAGQGNAETVYNIDNVKWARAGYNGCVVDNETPGLLTGWRYFANGHLEAEAYEFEIVDNPNVAGINTSLKVGKFVKASDALPFAGMYITPDLESPIDWKGVKTAK